MPESPVIIINLLSRAVRFTIFSMNLQHSIMNRIRLLQSVSWLILRTPRHCRLLLPSFRLEKKYTEDKIFKVNRTHYPVRVQTGNQLHDTAWLFYGNDLPSYISFKSNDVFHLVVPITISFEFQVYRTTSEQG